MKFIQLADARDSIERLLDEVERGETIVITRGGSPAKPSRRADPQSVEKWRMAMQDLRDLKKGPGLATIEELLKWGEEVRRSTRGSCGAADSTSWI